MNNIVQTLVLTCMARPSMIITQGNIRRRYGRNRTQQSSQCSSSREWLFLDQMEYWFRLRNSREVVGLAGQNEIVEYHSMKGVGKKLIFRGFSCWLNIRICNFRLSFLLCS